MTSMSSTYSVKAQEKEASWKIPSEPEPEFCVL